MTTPDTPWQRLDPRIIWVDGIYAALAFVPTGLALLVADEPHPSTLIPALIVALGGVLGAVRDTLRWLKTRYRLTEDLVEIRTGLLVRKYRSLRRERIRSVSTTARLRHRLAGLRVLTVGVGQPGAAGYEALHLDAVSRTAAVELRHELLNGSPEVTGAETDLTTAQPDEPDAHQPGTSVGAATTDADPDGGQVFARIRWSWLLYNVFSIWALVTAAGLSWGGYWLAQSFGLDPAGFVTGLLDWRALGTGRSVVIGFLLVGALGVLAMAVAFVSENWAFRLVRVDTKDGGVLRTSQGLFRTREVNRDVRRLRGVEISEPLLWRSMGMADTNVISTGLTIWSTTPATTILPRGPIGVARTVAARVLDLGGEQSPFDAPLPRHPGAAFRRRVGWALLTTAVVTGVLAWLGGTVDVVSSRIWLAGVALLPLMVGAAGVAYRALGHGIVGDYLVVRSGLVSRSTSALHRSAVIGWCLRESVLQRRLGLATVVATTAAGHGQYAAVDVPAQAAVAFAERAVPGLLSPLLDAPRDGPSRTSRASRRFGRNERGGSVSTRRLTRTLLGCGAVAPGLFILVFLVDGATRAGYDPTYHPVSALSLGPRGWIQITNFVLTGLLLLGFAVGLRRALYPGRASRWGPLAIGGYALSLLLSGTFVMDPMRGYPAGAPVDGSSANPSWHHVLHDNLGLVVFLSVPVACFVLARWSVTRPYARAWAGYDILTGLAGLALLIAFGTAWETAHPSAGLIQRAMIAVDWAWIIMLALRLLAETRSRAGEPSTAGHRLTEGV